MPKDFPKQGSTVFKSTLQRLSAKEGLCVTCTNTSGISGLSENLPRNFLLNGSRILRTLFLYTDLGKTDKQYLKNKTVFKKQKTCWRLKKGKWETARDTRPVTLQCPLCVLSAIWPRCALNLLGALG